MFFFFKQKTAYELRISDWSSDVCSSNLVLQAKPLAREPVEQRRPLRRVLPGPFHITFDTDLLREHALPNVDVDCQRPGQRAECRQIGGQTGRLARPADCLEPSYDLVCGHPVGAATPAGVVRRSPPSPQENPRFGAERLPDGDHRAAPPF